MAFDLSDQQQPALLVVGPLSYSVSSATLIDHLCVLLIVYHIQTSTQHVYSVNHVLLLQCAISSHTMCQLNGFRKSIPPQNRQLVVHCYLLKHKVDGLVGDLNF